jgi:hypothetical protein
MVTALVKEKKIEIKNLDDLASVVETTRQSHESLILIGDQDARVKVDPARTMTDEERRAAFEASYGAWKGLVDTEKLKRDIYASRGQRDRDWMIGEETDHQE